MTMSSGGWETEVVIQITEEGANATDAAIKRVTRSLKAAQEAAKSPVNPFGKGSGSMMSDFGVDKMEKARGSLFHMGVEYERTSAKMKAPLGGYDANMQLTAKNFSVASKGLDALGNKAPEVTKKLSQGFGDAAQAVRIFRTLVIATGLEKFISNIVTTTDALTNLQNKIKTVAIDQEHANYIFTQSMEIAKETRSSITDVATVYARTSRAIQDMGVSTTATLQFTKTLSKAVAVGGSTAIEASQAMIQLSQGLASGKLSGDELRSVLEQLPVVAKLIADGMGKPVGELRKLGALGKITAEEVFKGIIAGTKQMDEEFAKMTPTFEKGWQAIKNGATEAMEVFQPTVTGMAQSMIDFGDSFDYVAQMIDLLTPKLENSKLLKIMQWLPVKVAELAANAVEGASFLAGKIGLGDPITDIQTASDAAELLVQWKKDDEELARLEQEYYDSKMKPHWKKATPEPKKEGGLTFAELLMKQRREKAIAGAPEAEGALYKEFVAKMGSLKKSVRESLFTDDGENDVFLQPDQTNKLIDLIRQEHDMADALKLVAQMEKTLQEAREARIKASVDASKHEQDSHAKISERMQSENRSFLAALDPLRAYNAEVEKANQFIVMNQDLLRENPKLYSAIEHSISKLVPIYNDLVGIMDQVGVSIADAAANALVFGDNLGKAFEQIAKAAASQLISSFIQFGVSSLAGVMGGNPVAGVTGGTALLPQTPDLQLTPINFGIPGAVPVPGGATGGYFGPGGYTGNGHIGDVAGVVHGKEFVVNSNATARNRATLEAMNAGKPIGGMGTTVNVHNYAGAEVETRTNSKGEIEVMIRKAIAEQAPAVIAGDLRNANSRTAKAMRQVYDTSPRR